MESDTIGRDFVLMALAMLLYGVCNGVEVALLAAQKSRLQQWREAGKRGAAGASRIREAPEPFVITLQMLMTFAGVVAAVLAGAVAVRDLTPWMMMWWPLPDAAGWSLTLALALMIGVLTYVALTMGQLVPRALAQQYPEYVLCWAARPLMALTKMCGVVRTMLKATVTVILWFLRQRCPSELASTATITEEEVTTMVREGAERGIFEAVEHELIKGVFEFTDTAAREVMVPRVRIQALEVITPPQEVIHTMSHVGHSRVPVYSGDLDHIIGILYFKDLIRAIGEDRPWTLRALLHPPLFVPETVQISRLLRMLQQRRLSMAMVVDEHGGIAGLVTIEDLLEQLVGEIADEDELGPDTQVVRLPDGSLVIQGSVPLWELRERFALPVEESSDYQTLAGLLLARLGRIPQGGESIVEQEYKFTVVDMDGPRIARVKVEKHLPEDGSGPTLSMPPRDTD